MPRLSTTTLLSALALFVGMAATCGLSALTDRVMTPTVPVHHGDSSTHRIATSSAAAHRTIVSDAARVSMRQAPTDSRQRSVDARDTVVAPVAELLPLSMPADTSRSWSELRGHLDGNVVLQLDIDGAGQVRHAAVAVSSGDPVLDEHALRNVSGWRFDVPSGHPDGLSGRLPMRFRTGGASLASTSE